MMKEIKVKVRVPATTANLGPGFDCLGLALKLYNTVEVIFNQSPIINHQSPIKIEIEGEGRDSLPRDERNIVYQAVRLVFDKLQITDYKLQIKLVNQIPLARGLGSSAAARIGGLVAANGICGEKLSDNEILNIATRLEGHPDNVVPAFFGGFCVSLPYTRTVQGELDKEEVNYVKLRFPQNLEVVLCIPELKISTERARRILPKRVPLGDAVFNSSRVALLISALREKRYDLLKLATEDRLHQPFRERLIPGFKKILENAYRQGALGVALSGSGSTILALSKKRRGESEKIGQAMSETFKEEGIKSRYLVLGVDQEGVKVEKNRVMCKV